MTRRLRAARRDDGFTLVELLIVIVVLGVLAGIVVFGVANFKADATSAACKSDVKTVQVAYDAYVARNGSAPSGGTSAAMVTSLVSSDFLKAAPATTVSITAGTVSGGC